MQFTVCNLGKVRKFRLIPSLRSQQENIANIVSATASEGILVIYETSFQR